jgi:sterol desaturase/sphingolipid hydroxylase (fatty acid hydroxylase superfamily)
MKSVLSAAIGVASWSLTEYVVHRYLGHVFARNRNFFAVEHVRHHATTSYFAPAWKKGGAAAIVAAAVMPVAGIVAGKRDGLAFTAGLVGAYLGYEWLHYRAHVAAPANRYQRWLRKHHFFHHFHSPGSNHGVTSPLWDKVFGTYQQPTVVEVPARHAMPWLCDPKTGVIDARFTADYRIVDKRRPRAAA